MMTMQSMPSAIDDFPSAIELARLKDIQLNNNVLYRLVKPTEAGTEVVSVNRLCNVVPHRRIYRFDHKDELAGFCNELLHRPLVLQPLVHFGRGLGHGKFSCGMCYKDDKWVLLVNQTHPKILSRLQIGLDIAKNAMDRGQSFEIKFAFSKIVQKLYRGNLTKEEQETAAKTLDLVKSYFRYAEWEHGDLIIRYYGYAGLMGRGGGFREMTTINLKFTFEDLESKEIRWKALGVEGFLRPHLAPLTEDEIREVLPYWTVNSISPLEKMGDHVPEANYSYAQAGRLYESFRKKKREHFKTERDEDKMMEAAAASPTVRTERGKDKMMGVTAARVTVSDGIELRVTGHEDERFRPYVDDDGDGEYEYGFTEQNDFPYDFHHQKRPSSEEDIADERYGNAGYRPTGSYSSKQHSTDLYSGAPQEELHSDAYYQERGAKPKHKPQYDAHGHLYPKIKVVDQGHDSVPSGNYSQSSVSEGFAKKPMSDTVYNTNLPREKSQGPNTKFSSKQSTGPYANLSSQAPKSSYAKQPYANLSSQAPKSSYAKQPYENGSNGQERSYDQPPGFSMDLRDSFTRMQGSDRSSRSEAVDSGIASDSDHVRENSDDRTHHQYANTGSNRSPKNPYAMDNPGYHHDEDVDVGDALRKHRELVAKMMSGREMEVHTDRFPPPTRQGHLPKITSNGSALYSQTTVAADSVGSKSTGPMTVSGRHGDYSNARGGGMPARSGYKSSVGQQKVDESFI